MFSWATEIYKHIGMADTQGGERVHAYEKRQHLIHQVHTHTGNVPKQSLPTRPSFHSVTLHEVTLIAVEGMNKLWDALDALPSARETSHIVQ